MQWMKILHIGIAQYLYFSISTSHKVNEISNRCWGGHYLKCNNAEICNIECSLYGTCQQMKIYTSSINTTINCKELATCYDIIMYTDYTNYPLSNTKLICTEYGCHDWSIVDSISSLDLYRTGSIQQERFKINARNSWRTSRPRSSCLLSIY